MIFLAFYFIDDLQFLNKVIYSSIKFIFFKNFYSFFIHLCIELIF